MLPMFSQHPKNNNIIVLPVPNSLMRTLEVGREECHNMEKRPRKKHHPIHPIRFFYAKCFMIFLGILGMQSPSPPRYNTAETFSAQKSCPLSSATSTSSRSCRKTSPRMAGDMGDMGKAVVASIETWDNLGGLGGLQARVEQDFVQDALASGMSGVVQHQGLRKRSVL